MDELINDMKRKGLISFISRGKAGSVFELVRILATTALYQPDEIDWACWLALIRN